jgi:hypothetical protein
MKLLAIILSLAVVGITLASDFTPASASRMNGKCCMSSDGGRSYRYRMAMRLAAMPQTCSAYAVLCIRLSSSRPDRFPMCQAAKTQCMKTGVQIGPYSGRQFAGLHRM